MVEQITSDVIAEYKDYLADVLCVWDCYEQDWMKGSPIILRFENSDVVIEQRPSSGGTSTASFLHGTESETLENLSEGSAKDVCLCWRHRTPEGIEIGQEYSVGSLLKVMQK